MRRATVVTIAVVGLLFPLGLAFAVYVASAGSLAEPTGVAAVPAQPIAQATVTVQRPRGTTGRVTTAAATVDEGDDVSGKCDEPENRSDPDCTGMDGDGGGQGRGRGRGRGRGGDASDSSGSGSGSGSGESGSGNSGSDSGGDSDSSGHGGGDD